MKFAAIALVATASAIQLREQKGDACVSKADTDDAFAHIDKGGNGTINARELSAAIERMAKSQGLGPPPKEDLDWIIASYKRDAGEDHVLNKHEFWEWSNQFAKHFHIGGC